MASTLIFDSASVAYNSSFGTSLSGNEPDFETFDNDVQRWHEVGRFFGLLGREPFPPQDLAPVLLDAFHDGMQSAECEIDRDKADTYAAELDRLQTYMEEMDGVCSGYCLL